jgi:hypothetical protein
MTQSDLVDKEQMVDDAELARAARMVIATKVAEVLSAQCGCLRTSQLVEHLRADFDLPEEMGYDGRKLFGFLGSWSEDFVFLPSPPGLADEKDAGIGLRSLLLDDKEDIECAMLAEMAWSQAFGLWPCDESWACWDPTWWSESEGFNTDAPEFIPMDTGKLGEALSACSTAANTPCFSPEAETPALPHELFPVLGLPEAECC